MTQQYSLPNGIRVVTQRIPSVRSVSLGVWVKVGSCLESPQENGLSHFMEHMAFKGTQKRTAKQIAQEMDAVGGMLNAATSKVNTCYYAKVLDEDMPLAADILADITVNPLIDQGELEKERGVVTEEIGMVEDSPEDVVFDMLAKAMFGDRALGMTILGPEENILRYTREDLLAFRQKHYGPQNTVISAAGSFDESALKDALTRAFGSWQNDAADVFPQETPNIKPVAICRDKPVEQVHISIGYRGLPLGDKRIYALSVMNNIFGGGMSSRLFQHIREELGMAYSVYAGPSSYPTCGDYTIYAATSPKHVRTVLEQIDIQIQQLLEKGVSRSEFDRAKTQLRGGFLLGQESAYSRMSALGSNLCLQDRVIPPEETLEGILRVTPEDVASAARETFEASRSVAILGKNAEKCRQYIQEAQ